MAKFEEAMNRKFKGIWVCNACNHKNRCGNTGSKPDRCRKCHSTQLRKKAAESRK
ncbi:MAG: 50S ribosomal protein L40e [Candidatus Diapherotrites archaeon]|nr:50S ribosomal protein L40e [Candidatus Diapherotrites archaeon]